MAIDQWLMVLALSVVAGVVSFAFASSDASSDRGLDEPDGRRGDDT